MIRAYEFVQGKAQCKAIEPAAIAHSLTDSGVFVWVDFEKSGAEEAMPILADVFHFHPLTIEDCIDESASPKVEEYTPQTDDKFAPYIFMVVHAVDYNRKDGVFATRELNVFLGKNFLVSYHDVPLRSVAAVEDRCVKGAANTGRAPDRLAHALLDEMVDNYRPALDELSREIAALEERSLQNPRPATLHQITQTKKEVLRLRQIISPQSEVLARLARGEFKLIRPQMLPYFRDIADALFHISTEAQSYADSLTGTLQVYLSMSANRTNEIVKVLTIITVLTTPLTIIGTWYGMNFKGMPELEWPHGYLIATLLMIFSTAGTFWFFKIRKWF